MKKNVQNNQIITACEDKADLSLETYMWFMKV